MSNDTLYCHKCGSPNSSHSNFCQKCGGPLAGPSPGVQAQPVGKPSSCLKGCLVGFLVITCIGLAGVAATGIFFRDELGQLIATLRENALITVTGPGTTRSSTLSGANSLSVTTALEGVVTAANGASITIPSGAVPVMDDGSQGTMVFSVEVDPSRSPQLAGAYAPVGPVFNLGPEGFVFSSPVMVSLPIPEEIDLGLVLGLTYYDAQADSWKLVPGTVDPDSRTISAETTHFSSWGIFGSCIGDVFGGCEYYESRDRWQRENGGWISVNNTHVRESGSYPGASHKPMSSGYGVCIQSYSFDKPDDAWNWLEPVDWKIWAHDQRHQDYWLPSGQFNLLEVIHLSEVNHDPLYIPAYTTYWRMLGPHILSPGQTLTFNSPSMDSLNDGYTEGRPPCWGEETTSVGTGDIQVTLSWSAYADIDLYVQDPAGDVVYYGNTYVSSGGELDRDNTCGNYIEGQPENIYWPSQGAPNGTYQVRVHYYGDCDNTGPVQWTVRTVIGGQVQNFSGTLPAQEAEQEVTSFSIP